MGESNQETEVNGDCLAYLTIDADNSVTALMLARLVWEMMPNLNEKRSFICVLDAVQTGRHLYYCPDRLESVNNVRIIICIRHHASNGLCRGRNMLSAVCETHKGYIDTPESSNYRCGYILPVLRRVWAKKWNNSRPKCRCVGTNA